MRLFSSREYRAAVISAIMFLENALRDRLDLPKVQPRRPMPLRELLERAKQQELLENVQIHKVLEWLKVRNEVVYSQRTVSRSTADQIVRGVLDIVRGLDERRGRSA